MKRTLEVAAAAAAALALAACPGEREIEEPAATEMPVLEVGQEPEPVLALPLPERVALQEVAGSGVTAEAVVSPLPGETHVVVLVRQAPPNAAVRASLHGGTCAEPGAPLEALQPVTTDELGTGRSETSLEVAPQLVFDGRHHVQVHANAVAPGEMSACGDIPARSIPVMEPGVSEPLPPDTL